MDCSHLSCSSCISAGNPMCGWCVVENKCSQRTQCRDGDSSSSTRWIPSTPVSNVNKCLRIRVSPASIDLQSPQIVSSFMTVKLRHMHLGPSCRVLNRNVVLFWRLFCINTKVGGPVSNIFNTDFSECDS